MNGELAMMVALAAHGSAWLGGRLGPTPPALEASNSTFQFVRETRFTLAGGFMRSPIESTGVADWLVGLQKRQTARIWLATGGATPWHLVATPRKGQPETWLASWTATNPDAADRRIWSVELSGRRDGKAQAPRINPAEAQARLVSVLADVETFARDQGVEEWAAVFSAAVRLGELDDPVPPFHPDMFPAMAFGRAARRLLAMATRAWVFGGEGSWNDLGFETPAATASHRGLTSDLESAVLDAFVGAVNAPLDR